MDRKIYASLVRSAGAMVSGAILLVRKAPSTFLRQVENDWKLVLAPSLTRVMVFNHLAMLWIAEGSKVVFGWSSSSDSSSGWA